MSFVKTDLPPTTPSRQVATRLPQLMQTEEHELCPGCGEPIVMRLLAEVIEAMGVAAKTIGIVGHGCYTPFVTMADLDFLQCLHGRAPSAATGVKRMRSECMVFTLQGDGDMVSEGLQEVLHTAARGERITCILLNNGVFGDTGGQMTSTTALGQRTKTSIDGRDAEQHGFPIPIADVIAQLQGSAYVARGAVNSAGNIARTKKLIRRAFEVQLEGEGLTFVEILTMCPTGWFVPTAEGPDYMVESVIGSFQLGELKGS